jgi:hypothetical protein
VSLSSTKLRASLHQLQRERQQLLRRLTQEHELAIGTVALVHRKCGNPRCHCAQGEGHAQILFLFKDADSGRRRCKLVRRADEDRLQQAGDRYREFREGLARLRAIDKEEKQILMALAQRRALHYE